LRVLVLDFESNDYKFILARWYDYLVDHGRWSALKDNFSCYSSLYLSGLSISTLLPLPKLYAVKLLSMIFDYVAAWIVYKIIRLRYPEGPVPYIASIVLLFLPTLWFNSAVWAQCDGIYTSALLGTFYFIMVGKPVLALALYGIGWGLKPQAIFLAPFLGGLCFRSVLPWKLIFVPGVAYVLCGLPEILAGRPVFDVIFHWVRQHNEPGLTLGATNWYQWISNDYEAVFYVTGIWLAMVASALLVFAMQKDSTIERKNWLVTSSLCSVLLVPYFLPGMHERYFYAADVFSLVYAFFVSRGWILALCVQFASLFSYFPFLFDKEPIPRPLLALLMTAAFGAVVTEFARSLQLQRKDCRH